MRVIKKTTLDRVFNKLYRDLGLEEISEADVIDWTGEVLEHIGVVNMLEEHVAFVEVKNHKAELPTNLVDIIQVARNNAYSPTTKGVCYNEVKECIVEDTCPECPIDVPAQNFVPVDCYGRVIGDYEVAYYRPFFDLQYEYYLWGNSTLYSQNFSPVRLSNKTFFGSMVCEENPQLYSGSRDEYTISGNNLVLSFKEGQVAIAYHSFPLDPDTGYPMIPDEVSVIQAIVSYITYKYMQRLWYLGREGYGDKYRQAETDYHWYIDQAKTKLFGPYGIDDFQDLLDQKTFMPNMSKYNQFFSGDSYKKIIATRRSHNG